MSGTTTNRNTKKRAAGGGSLASGNRMRNKKEKYQKFTIRMQKKLVVLFLLIFFTFVGLSGRLIAITRESGAQYEKQVLSQQRYDSMTIPYKRGEILDAMGTSLAISEKVYNVILDTKALLADEEYLEPTLEALRSEFGFNTEAIRTYIKENPSSQYYLLDKRLTYEEIAGFRALQADTEANPNIQGVWFEEEYRRFYPNGSLASDVIGFTTSDNNGLNGLEKYYNDVLAGTPGREYGYLNEEAELERTTIAAVDGNNIVTTLDAHIQGIVEKHLQAFNEEFTDNYREGNGAYNVGCIIMEVNTGNILAMGSYPNFDLNDTKNTNNLLGMAMVDGEGKPVKPLTPITQELINTMDDDTLSQNYNSLWKNFCISDTYEPGSVMKPFTVAGAIESGSITGNETYECNGHLEVADRDINCHNTYGDGIVSVQRGVEISCNVAMMKIAAAMGKDHFLNYQYTFNFGLKTNIDLEGEARTVGLVYHENNMRSVELATCSFGQGFNTTMIQTITGFCSLINGGNYYEPHVVQKIVSPTGATIRNIEPRLLKQTISPETSDIIREYCNLVVSGPEGTGHTARPAGYLIGGKTGTAEMAGRDKINYVVSFMGYAPIDNPEIAIYVVVDRPNAFRQDDAKFATRIVKSILTEVLPYRQIYPTEALTEEEAAELDSLRQEMLLPPSGGEDAAEGTGADGADGESSDTDGIDGSNGDADASGENGNAGENEDAGEGEGTEEDGDTDTTGASDDGQGDGNEKIWQSFPIDPDTGYAVDPNTGAYVDPVTGATIGGSFTEEGQESVLPPVDDGSSNVPF